jgi:hypothetical protein
MTACLALVSIALCRPKQLTRAFGISGAPNALPLSMKSTGRQCSRAGLKNSIANAILGSSLSTTSGTAPTSAFG